MTYVQLIMFNKKRFSQTLLASSDGVIQSKKTQKIISYVCMHLMIGKGQIAQKDHIGAKIDLRAKFVGKYNCLVVF